MDKLSRKMAKGPAKLQEFLKANPVPCVVGPGGTLYLIDHHHLARALYNLGIET